MRRIPFSISLAFGILLVLLGTGSLIDGPRPALARAVGFQTSDLLHGRWWTIFTTVFFTGNLATFVLAAALLVAGLGLAESTMGTGRTIAAFFTTQLAAVVVFTVAVELGASVHLEWLEGMRGAMLLGPFAGAAGAIMTASRLISVLWRRRLQSVTVASTLMLLLYVGHSQNLLVFLGVICGLVLGIVRVPARASVRLVRSTSHEARTNLSIIVAVFAAGPLMAAVAHVPVGPLAVLRNLIVNPIPTISQLQLNCVAAVDVSCRDVTHGAGLVGPGGQLLALVPMLLLLVCAEGLRRGNRLALWITVYLYVVIGVMSAIYLQLFAQFGLRRGHHDLPLSTSLLELGPVVLLPFVIALVLLRYRRHFNVDPNPELRHRTFIVLPLVLVGFLGLYAVAWFAEGNYHDRNGLAGLIAGLPRVLVPYPFPFRYAISVYPHGFFSELLFAFGGAAFWIFSVLSVLALFLSRRISGGAAGADKALAGELVRRGGDSLSWMALWPNNSYWFNASRTVGLAYQSHFGVAVTVGGPFGERADVEAALEEFLTFCAEASLVPCLYSITDTHWRQLQQRGFRRVAVAQETLLEIQTMEFKGKEWQNVRTALNKAGKLGIEAQWYRYSTLTTSLRTQIHEISEEWVSEKALPEMGFTLGGVQELRDDNVLICLAVDGDGKVHGVTSWLPVFSGGAVVSWTLDFMRRNSDSFNGVMEFLIAEAVLHFRPQVSEISLSGSPLAFVEGEEDGDDQADVQEDAAMERILGLLGRTLEPVYGFQSLAKFKRRFQPRHRTLYMMYQDPLALPAIGRAVAEAYMPNLSMRQTARLFREAVG